MKEFVEKLIGRLEESKDWIEEYPCTGARCPDEIEIVRLDTIKEIVNQLAEEYNNKDCSQCSRRSWYQKGYADAEKKFSEECNNDFCKWRKQDGYNFYVHKTSCGTEDTFDDSYKYCPYCGKKIKVLE